MQLPNEILYVLIEEFATKIHKKKILGFTEMVKDKIIIQAGIDYKNSGCWYDNVMVDWEGSKHLIAAELKMLFRFENERQSYAVIHSCHKRVEDHSVLSKIWFKDYRD